LAAATQKELGLITSTPEIKKESIWGMRGVQISLLVLICLVGFGIRLYNLKDPPLDFHPTRQLRSALIARSVYYQMNPSADLQLRQQAVNMAGLEVYEPPILEYMVGMVYLAAGKEIVWVARIINALFWVIGGLAIAHILWKRISFYAILVSLSIYFFLPFSVIASRSFQPEPWMVMWILLSADAVLRWWERPTWKRVVVAGVIGGVAVLVKAVAVYFVLGAMAAVVLDQFGLRRLFKTLQPWLMACMVVAPTAIYYLFFQGHRSGDFLSFWMIKLSGLILTTKFYAQWLAMMQGLVGLVYIPTALLGVLVARRPLRSLLLGLWVGYALYGITFPYQYTTHEYYHLPLVALVALSVASVLDLIFERLWIGHWFWRLAGVVIILFATGYSLWVSRSIMYTSRNLNEPASWRRVGDALPAGRSFVGLTNDYGMRLRYYGWRIMSSTWPSTADLNLASLAGSQINDTQTLFKELTLGKDLFLVTAFSEMDAQPELKEILENNYSIYYKGNGFIIYDLKNLIKPKNPTAGSQGVP
jgi:4-amino-4-deoxy-L-arabinose transferase-like glycosyltransferase